MSKALFVSVDLGTSFIKAAVYDIDSNCIAISKEPVTDERPGPGIFIQRGEDLFVSVVNCLKSVTEEIGECAANVEAIAFTGQMSGFMGVDKDWNDITTWSCSLDTRYIPYADEQIAKYRDEFMKISGTNFPQMAPKAAWFKDEYPTEDKKIAKYLMISGYIIGKLGELDIEYSVIDTTFTVWTGLMDIAKGDWSDDICEKTGVDKSRLPRIVNSNTVCGKLSCRMAETIGLKAGIPLVSGAGDKAAGSLGGATVEVGMLGFEASSYGQIANCTKDWRPDIATGRMDCMMASVPGLLHTVKFVVGSGITLDWYINTFVRKEGEKLGDAFDRMEEKMKSVDVGCNGLMAIGLLSGSSMPLDGALRGLWMGFDWSHRPEHFYKALLESFAFDFALSLDKMRALYPELPQTSVRVVGGGASSRTWMQMNADVTGLRYEIVDRDDVAMWGAAILAANAIGLIDNMQAKARQHVSIKKVYEPNPNLKKKYDALKDLYLEQTAKQHNTYNDIQAVHNK